MAQRLNDTNLVPGLNLWLLSDPGGAIVYSMVEVYDYARNQYISTGVELEHLTINRQAAGWAGVIALARGLAATARKLS